MLPTLVGAVVGLLLGALLSSLFFRRRLQQTHDTHRHECDLLKTTLTERAADEQLKTRRRLEKRADAEANRKLEAVTVDLLPLMDAMLMVEDLHTDQVEPVKKGVSLVLNQLQTTLSRHGCEAIIPQPGEPFDPVTHEAVGCEGAPEVVLTLHRIGYRVHSTVIRAASVTVGSRASIPLLDPSDPSRTLPADPQDASLLELEHEQTIPATVEA